MKIFLSPQRRDDALKVYKAGDVLTLNGEKFDLSPLNEGDSLAASAISSQWFIDDVTRTNGELVITLLLPNPSNYSPAQAFPQPLVNVREGEVVFPQPLAIESTDELPDTVPEPEWPATVGAIDWSQLITAEMKVNAAAASQLTAVKSELAAKNASAAAQIARIQDRIDTLGYGIDIGKATDHDEAEQDALRINLKEWKTYKFSLGKLPAQSEWPTAPEWPDAPVVPAITADPQIQANGLI